jgi:dTDP-4-dehydrorhamnose reductase
MSAFRLIITGSNGQVAQSLKAQARAHGVEAIAVGRPALDLAAPASIREALAAARPDAIVNAAAYTQVDRADEEPGVAMAINGDGAGAVAAAAATLKVPLIHLSTDYVFDGGSDRPYREEDATAPLGAYGRSKLAGEAAVAEATSNYAILRTAWVYSPFGTNFMKTMLRLAATRPELKVVADQIGTPTCALDIADGVIKVAANLLAAPREEGLRGVFHMTASGETTWFGFATEIFAVSAACGGPSSKVRPIPSRDYPTPARRPANSRLDCAKLAATHGVRLRPWRAPLAACVAALLAESGAAGDE